MQRRVWQDSQKIGSAAFPLFHRVDNALRGLGIDSYQLYRDLGLKWDADKHLFPLVSTNEYIALLNLAADRYCRPCIGIDIAKVRDINSFDILSYVMKNSPTYGDVVNNINAYAKTVTPGAIGSVHRSGKQLAWQYCLPGFPYELVRHEIEMTLMEIIDATRVLLNQADWSPISVFFQHRSRGQDEFLSSKMGCEVVFSHTQSCLMIEPNILSNEIQGADHDLYTILLAQIEKLIGDSPTVDPFLHEIDFYLSVRMGSADCSAKSIAKEMSMSLRSFYRQLDVRRVKFSKIKEEKRLSIAKKALASGNVSITELAFRLGYSDLASFHRAFKRATFITPTAYRTLQQRKS